MLVDMLLRLKSIVYLPGDFVVKKVSYGHMINIQSNNERISAREYLMFL